MEYGKFERQTDWWNQMASNEALEQIDDLFWRIEDEDTLGNHSLTDEWGNSIEFSYTQDGNGDGIIPLY